MNTVTTFRDLHARAEVLVLPNAWDAASAALFRSVGAKAIATTSAGFAWSCGFADGDALPRENLVFAVREILRVCGNVPVSVDLESGFSDDPKEVASLALELSALGVAGINLEDAAKPPELLEEKIGAIKRAVTGSGRDIFINARTDVFLRDLVSGDAALNETVERAQRYARAGADGIFVPMLTGSDDIRAVASATRQPLNILATRNLPALKKMHELGVRRLSAGSSISKVAFACARRAAQTFLREGPTEDFFASDAVDYGEMNALLA